MSVGWSGVCICQGGSRVVQGATEGEGQQWVTRSYLGISLTMATPPPEYVVYTSFCLPDSFAQDTAFFTGLSPLSQSFLTHFWWGGG